MCWDSVDLFLRQCSISFPNIISVQTPYTPRQWNQKKIRIRKLGCGFNTSFICSSVFLDVSFGFQIRPKENTDPRRKLPVSYWTARMQVIWKTCEKPLRSRLKSRVKHPDGVFRKNAHVFYKAVTPSAHSLRKLHNHVRLF